MSVTPKHDDQAQADANINVPIRLQNRLDAQAAGRAFRIVVRGNCTVCKRRSGDVPATKSQVLRWYADGDTTSFLKYQIRMLKTGVHRKCQPIQDAKNREKAEKRAAAAARKRPVVLEADKVERAIARRARARA